ncbi:MAG: aminoglycoside phosphotransferase family protein [Streptosporangiaceae bacterium]
MTQPPPAEGRRLPWQAIPGHLRDRVEDLLGARVLAAQTQPGGFSPGVAARLTLTGGGRAFVKAVGDLNPDSPGIHRSEARIAAALPEGTPAPRLLGSVDTDGWVILLLEDIEGRMPAQPWRSDELVRVLDAMTGLAAALSPAPIEAPSAAVRFHSLGHGWRNLANARAEGDKLADVSPWARDRVYDLAALESHWAGDVAGTTLAHGDVRADNILLTPSRVVFVDWPWACLAKPWFDLVALLPSVTLQGGQAPEEVLAAHPLADGADPDDVTTAVAALAGMWIYLGRRPDPPGIPTLRAFQRAHSAVALDWLAQRVRTCSAGLGLG